jgi:hypothetical protein
LVTAVAGVVRVGIFDTNEQKIAVYLNRTYPNLEESADLLMQTHGTLSQLQLLQRKRIEEQIQQILPSIKLPHHLGKAFLALAISAGVSLLLGRIERQQEMGTLPSAKQTIKQTSGRHLPETIREAQVIISPPAYTLLDRDITTDLDLQIPEGSLVTWQFTFSGEVLHPVIIFPQNDSLSLKEQATGTHTAKKAFSSSTFYQLAWLSADSIRTLSPFYKLQVVRDLPPEISTANLEQFQQVKPTDHLTVNVRATVNDDYGIDRTQIIATVSKGSGEAVKFREEKLQFEQITEISKKKLEASRSIDLLKLGMEPGDELYFYIQAYDNKTPVANEARTETYFITILDTAAVMTGGEMGLGVDVLPEYFRSQRQIIIDSEKLLKEKSTLPKESFNNRSNGLAHDQKLLRLRYGEFLGEEFESSIGPDVSVEAGDNENNIIEKFGHAHDGDNEHNLVEDRHADTHDHGEDPQTKNTDPPSGMIHSHDNEEEATFFTQSIKAKLKAAIAIMWDAELHLRLYDPKTSLPHQYKALKLLKEISQQSRVYVHRTGFDPPPLKEDKRLTGDLSEINTSHAARQVVPADNYVSIRRAISVIEKLLLDSSQLSKEEKYILTQAGRTLAQLELDQPGRYLQTLSLLQSMSESDVAPGQRQAMLLKIRRSFWQSIPATPKNPQLQGTTFHALDHEFARSLDALKQENK